MSQLVGSCIGAFSSTCLLNLLSPKSGDFTAGPQWIPDLIDCLLVVSPFALTSLEIVHAGPLKWGIFSVVLLNFLVVIFTDQLHNKFYGIRVALPLTVGIFAALTDRLSPSVAVNDTLGLIGSATLGFILSICITDVGFLINVSLRKRLSQIRYEKFIRIAIQLMLISVSMYLILFSVISQKDHWIYVALMLVIVILSVVQSDHQRGSIVSSALTVYIITAVTCSIIPITLAVILTTIYNAFFLNKHVKDHDLLPAIPLLDDRLVNNHRMTAEHKSDVRFKFSAYNMILLAFFATGVGEFESNLFFQISLVTSAWILAAPLVLRNRQFPF